MVVIRSVLSILVLSGDKKNTPKHGGRHCSVAECPFACAKVKERTEFHNDSHSRTITHRRFAHLSYGNYTRFVPIVWKT